MYIECTHIHVHTQIVYAHVSFRILQFYICLSPVFDFVTGCFTFFVLYFIVFQKKTPKKESLWTIIIVSAEILHRYSKIPAKIP